MPKASDLIPGINTSYLLKGPPGFGKTIAACSAAIYGEVYLAYFDKREPIELLTFYKRFRPELLDRITWESYGSNNAHEYLNKLIEFQTRGCPYAAVITDSVTSLTSAAVNWSLSFRDAKGGKRDPVNNDAPAMIPGWDDYKVETSLVMQALDICKTLNIMNIWTAHPLPSLKITGTGNAVGAVSTVQSLVSYGNKVGALVPGAFTEQYHFGKQNGRRTVFTDMTGDDFAKTSIILPKMIDIEDRLFFEVWQELTQYGLEKRLKEVRKDEVKPLDPSALFGGPKADDPANRWKPKS